MLRNAIVIAIVVLGLLAPSAPAAQRTIALPDEFRPEGIASGEGASFYVGSIPQGSVYRGSYRTGRGEVLVPPHEGRNHTGLKVDKRFDRLFVSGGPSKGIYVYDANTGADLRSYSLPDAGFINDVVLTRNAAYFTDSLVQQLYRVPIGEGGRLGEVQRLPITGDLDFVDGFNANGIEAARQGQTLIVVQSNLGKLYTVNARSGHSTEIRLDEALTNGDGILLDGRTLYVVRNRNNLVAVVGLNDNLRRGEVVDELTDPLLDVPTTIAPFDGFIYAVNARFDRPDDSDDDIVRLKP
jgi:sugar lactone lactonase YvrE